MEYLEKCTGSDHSVGAFTWGLLKAISSSNDSTFDIINARGVQPLTHSLVGLNDFRKHDCNL